MQICRSTGPVLRRNTGILNFRWVTHKIKVELQTGRNDAFFLEEYKLLIAIQPYIHSEYINTFFFAYLQFHIKKKCKHIQPMWCSHPTGRLFFRLLRWSTLTFAVFPLKSKQSYLFLFAYKKGIYPEVVARLLSQYMIK